MSRVLEAAADYRRGLSFVDEAFRSAQEQLGESVPCRRGCSSCCAAVFDVPPADALLLGAWLDEQSDAVREEVLAVARGTRDAVEAAARALAEAGDADLAGWTLAEGIRALPSAALTRLAEASASARCPLLDGEGACRAHDSRPSLCRLQGLPWKDTATGAVLPDFCRLDPRQVANPPRSLDLARLDGLRELAGEAAREAAGESDAVARGRTFVADALIRWAERR